jgi:hypothetical protein
MPECHGRTRATRALRSPHLSSVALVAAGPDVRRQRADEEQRRPAHQRRQRGGRRERLCVCPVDVVRHAPPLQLPRARRAAGPQHVPQQEQERRGSEEGEAQPVGGSHGGRPSLRGVCTGSFAGRGRWARVVRAVQVACLTAATASCARPSMQHRPPPMPACPQREMSILPKSARNARGACGGRHRTPCGRVRCSPGSLIAIF